MKVVLVLVIAALCAATGESFLSYGMRSMGGVSIDSPGTFFRHLTVVVRNPRITLGVIFMGCFFYLYLGSLSWVDLSFAKPITALSFVFATLFASVFLRESVSWNRWLGTLLIVLGVMFVSMEKNRTTVRTVEREVPARAER